MTMKHHLAFAFAIFLASCPGSASSQPQIDRSERVKDLASFGGVRTNQLLGYGIVVGLNGTGDGNVAATNQTIQSLLSRFGMTVVVNAINAKNTAAVMVTRPSVSIS